MADAKADLAAFDSWFYHQIQRRKIPIAVLIHYRIGMFTTPKSLPSDPVELRIAAEGLVELAKTQALQIEKLKHQLAGHQRYRFRSKVDSAEQLNLQL